MAGFKQQRSRYAIARAPSGRARCRRCQKCPPKGAIVMAIDAFVRPNRRTRLYRCMECVDGPFARAVLAAHKRSDRVPAADGLGEDEREAARSKLDRAAS